MKLPNLLNCLAKKCVNRDLTVWLNEMFMDIGGTIGARMILTINVISFAHFIIIE
jgi:hypothetical protein